MIVGIRRLPEEIWKATIISYNFGDLNPEEMISLDKELNDSVVGVTIQNYGCEKDNYEIDSDLSSIKKNGEEIYDDYENSDFYAEMHPELTEDDFDIDDFEKVSDDETLVKCWVPAKKIIEAQLKAPSSAKFPFSSNSNDVLILKSVDNNKITRYAVISWVEAENSFGAQLRNDFCVLLYEVNGNKRKKRLITAHSTKTT